MTEHPIIFSTAMVRAILDGRKTQTRRIIKPQPPEKYEYKNNDGGNSLLPKKSGHYWMNGYAMWRPNLCPYGQVGNRLYIKEGYWIASGFYRSGNPLLQGRYAADETKFSCEVTKNEWGLWEKRKFPYRNTPGRFMYKSLARIFLEITNIRVERISDITIDDVEAEGIIVTSDEIGYLRFIDLWDSVNTKHGWDKNPWCWVIEFSKEKSPDSEGK